MTPLGVIFWYLKLLRDFLASGIPGNLVDRAAISDTKEWQKNKE
jgi:hypothetical protein